MTRSGLSEHKYGRERIAEFERYRYINRMLAYRRDGGNCVVHWYRGVIKPATEIHHVYGHGNPRDMSGEHYSVLLSVCNECHYRYHSIDNNADEIKLALLRVNEQPLESDFDPELDKRMLERDGAYIDE